jgi:hypothetical protein
MGEYGAVRRAVLVADGVVCWRAVLIGVGCRVLLEGVVLVDRGIEIPGMPR